MVTFVNDAAHQGRGYPECTYAVLLCSRKRCKREVPIPRSIDLSTVRMALCTKHSSTGEPIVGIQVQSP